MSLSLLMQPTVLMGKHAHQAPDRKQPNKASPQTSSSSSSTSSLLSRALLFPGRARRSSTVVTPQPAHDQARPESQNSATTTPIQPRAHDPKPARTRVPAVTSKAMTTAPEKDKSRPHRRKYPSNMRQRH